MLLRRKEGDEELHDIRAVDFAVRMHGGGGFAPRVPSKLPKILPSPVRERGPGTRTNGPRTLSTEALTCPCQESMRKGVLATTDRHLGERSRSECSQARLDSHTRNSFVLRWAAPDLHLTRIPRPLRRSPAPFPLKKSLLFISDGLAFRGETRLTVHTG